MMFRVAVNFFWTIWVVLTLAGCTGTPQPLTGLTPTPTPPPFTCGRFMENYWQEFRFGVDTPDDVVARVVKLWSIDKDEVGILWDPPWNWVRWEGGFDFASSTSQTAMFDTAENLMHIVVDWRRWKSSMPTVAQVLDCLGTPDYYSAARVEDNSDWLKFDLWFLEKGLFVQGSFNLDQEEVPTIQPETLETLRHTLKG